MYQLTQEDVSLQHVPATCPIEWTAHDFVPATSVSMLHVPSYEQYMTLFLLKVSSYDSDF